jgi:hypothetical protein
MPKAAFVFSKHSTSKQPASAGGKARQRGFASRKKAEKNKIGVQLTKNLLAKSSTKRFREYIKKKRGKADG